jgi:hypothetical protein
VSERYGDETGAFAPGGPYAKLGEGLAEAKDAIAARLGEMGFELFPRSAGGQLGDLASAVGKENLHPVPVFSGAPKETVLGLSRSGVRRKGGETLERAHVRVSLGPNEAASALEAARTALASLKPRDEKDRQALGRGIKEIVKYAAKLPSQPDGCTLVRYGVNVLHELDDANRLKGPLRGLTSFLEKNGYQELTVPLGDMFDDSFSPSKYERRRMPSDRAAGTILGVIQRGFMDPKGVPIQKAVVAVSKG